MTNSPLWAMPTHGFGTPILHRFFSPQKDKTSPRHGICVGKAGMTLREDDARAELHALSPTNERNETGRSGGEKELL